MVINAVVVIVVVVLVVLIVVVVIVAVVVVVVVVVVVQFLLCQIPAPTASRSSSPALPPTSRCNTSLASQQLFRPKKLKLQLLKKL